MLRPYYSRRIGNLGVWRVVEYPSSVADNPLGTKGKVARGKAQSANLNVYQQYDDL